MTKNLIELDDHREKGERRSARIEKKILNVLVDQELLQRHQENLETLLLASPANTWREAALTAQYLLQLFARTPEAQKPHLQDLITQVFDDLERLSIGEDAT